MTDSSKVFSTLGFAYENEHGYLLRILRKVFIDYVHFPTLLRKTKHIQIFLFYSSSQSWFEIHASYNNAMYSREVTRLKGPVRQIPPSLISPTLPNQIDHGLRVIANTHIQYSR
jgi:hypothetical protein